MYPEIIGADDTKETNSEERPLFTLCGKDDNNQMFTIINCFMPSQSQWVFSWMLKIALPNFHPGSALDQVNKLNSNTSPEEARVIDSVVGKHAAMVRNISSNKLVVPKIMSNALAGYVPFTV